jgi:uncharacterized protein YprB with RNaseH-like and TPR domain
VREGRLKYENPDGSGQPLRFLKKRLRYLDEQAPGRGGAVGQEKGQEAGGRQAQEPEPFTSDRGWDPLGRYALRRRLRYPNPLDDGALSELLVPDGYGRSDLLFFDTETTGLSGGAGSSIFLIGTAWLEGQDLWAEQIFLRDFPGEGEFLAGIAERLKRHRLFVSYNGRAFDSHLLRTRFVLNRMELVLERQTDLLYWARRLWRRSLSDCSLGTVEREILGIDREADVAGFEIPGIYLHYLRSGRPGRLDLVFEHNLQDVLTLASLFVTVNRILGSRDREQRMDPASVYMDRAALGRFMLGSGKIRGVELLEDSFETGDESAGRSLSLHYKRRGEWRRAVSVWERMVEGRKSLFAAVELAKYHEHRLKEPEQALLWVHKMLSWGLPLDARLRRELARRRERLERKAARSASG